MVFGRTTTECLITRAKVCVVLTSHMYTLHAVRMQHYNYDHNENPRGNALREDSITPLAQQKWIRIWELSGANRIHSVQFSSSLVISQSHQSSSPALPLVRNACYLHQMSRVPYTLYAESLKIHGHTGDIALSIFECALWDPSVKWRERNRNEREKKKQPRTE